MSLPKLALSVRQPWAWAIIHADKDIENRSWRDNNPGLNHRGRVCIHAAKGITRDEYEEAADFMKMDLGIECPPARDLLRGGIIGTVDVIDVTTKSDSVWFFGPRGLVLRRPQPVDFIPAQGALGYFEWSPGNRSMVPPPAAWMMAGSDRSLI